MPSITTSQIIEDSPARVLDNLARAPESVLAHVAEGDRLALSARAAVLIVLACTCAFGATLGFHRGGLQMLYAGIKLPAVVLLTAALLTPLLTCLNRALDRPAHLQRDLALVLLSLARAALVLAAALPVLWLGLAIDANYHTMIMLAVGVCALAGAVGLSMFARGVARERRGRFTTLALMLASFTMVGAHMTWVLRPYLVRPRTTEVPFLRALDGDFADAVNRSAHAAGGDYLPAEVTR